MELQNSAPLAAAPSRRDAIADMLRTTLGMSAADINVLFQARNLDQPSRTPEYIDANIKALQKMLRMDLAETRRFLRINPLPLTMSEATLEKRITAHSRILELSVADYRALVLRAPKLLTASEKLVSKNLHDLRENFPEVTNLTAQIRSFPYLVLYSPATLLRNINDVADILGVEPAAIRHAIRSQLHRCLRSPTSVERTKAALVELGFPIDRAVHLILTHPPVLSLTPANVITRAHEFAARLGCSLDLVRSLILRTPRLLTSEPSTVFTKLREIADAFDWSMVQTVDAVIRYPSLMTRKPASLVARVNALSDTLTISHAETLALVHAQPQLLALDPRATAIKAGILQSLAVHLGESEPLPDLLLHHHKRLISSVERFRQLYTLAINKVGPQRLSTLFRLNREAIQKLLATIPACDGTTTPLTAS